MQILGVSRKLAVNLMGENGLKPHALEIQISVVLNSTLEVSDRESKLCQLLDRVGADRNYINNTDIRFSFLTENRQLLGNVVAFPHESNEYGVAQYTFERAAKILGSMAQSSVLSVSVANMVTGTKFEVAEFQE